MWSNLNFLSSWDVHSKHKFNIIFFDKTLIRCWRCYILDIRLRIFIDSCKSASLLKVFIRLWNKLPGISLCAIYMGTVHCFVVFIFFLEFLTSISLDWSKCISSSQAVCFNISITIRKLQKGNDWPVNIRFNFWPLKLSQMF